MPASSCYLLKPSSIKQIRDALQGANVSVVRFDSYPHESLASILCIDPRHDILHCTYCCHDAAGQLYFLPEWKVYRSIKLSAYSSNVECMTISMRNYSRAVSAAANTTLMMTINIDPHVNITVDPAQEIPESETSTEVNISVIHLVDNYCHPF